MQRMCCFFLQHLLDWIGKSKEKSTPSSSNEFCCWPVWQKRFFLWKDFCSDKTKFDFFSPFFKFFFFTTITWSIFGRVKMMYSTPKTLWRQLSVIVASQGHFLPRATRTLHEVGKIKKKTTSVSLYIESNHQLDSPKQQHTSYTSYTSVPTGQWLYIQIKKKILWKG